MKRALIDTDVLSYFFKGDMQIIRRVRDYLNEYPGLTISIITKYEILSGLEYKNARQQIDAFEKFLENCEIVNLSDESIRISARNYGLLRRRGVTIGASDLLIAGIAIENDWQLITNNDKHFAAIDGLQIDNWRL